MRTLRKYSMVLAGFAIAVGAVAFKATKTVQTPTYYMLNGVLTPLPGGAAGEGEFWICVDGDEICIYDESGNPIGSDVHKFVKLRD